MPSKRRQRRKRCTGKVRHRTEADAQYAAFLLRQEKGLLLDPYKCSFCHCWHLGHIRRQRQREGLRRLFALKLNKPD